MSDDPVIDELRRFGADRALSAVGVSTDEQLWGRLGSNRNGELCLLAMQIGVPPKTILELLAASALGNAKQYRSTWWKDHLPDFALGLAILGIAVMAIIVIVRSPSLHKTQVVAVRDIAPFVPIQKGDVKLASTEREPGAEEKIDQVTGRYALQPMRSGAVVNTKFLSSGKLTRSDAGRVVLRLPVGKAEVRSWGKLPDIVLLILSPKDPGKEPILIPDVDLLAVSDGASPSITVSVSDSVVRAIAGAAGSSVIHTARATH
jgi:hypothetical protein